MSNEDSKNLSMLNKLYLMKRQQYLKDPDEPAENIKECNSINDCYRWREQVIKKMSDKITEIQNAFLPESKIRSLNDEINTFLEVKRQWDKRIKELGGPNLEKIENKIYDENGIEVPGSGKYKYFGAAKDLPGVRELFYNKIPKAPKKNLELLYNNIDESYYIDSLDEDENYLESEIEFENQIKKIKIDEYIKNNFDNLSSKIQNFSNLSKEEIIKNIILIEEEKRINLLNCNDLVNKELEKKKTEFLKKYFNENEVDQANYNENLIESMFINNLKK